MKHPLQIVNYVIVICSVYTDNLCFHDFAVIKTKYRYLIFVLFQVV